MVESPQQPRNFKDLDNVEKIRAVLAYSHTPISPAIAVDIAKIDIEKLTEEDAVKIFAVFEEEGVRKVQTKRYQTEKGPVEREEYLSDETYKAKVWRSVSRDSVASAMDAFLKDGLNEMGIDFDI